MDTNLIVILWVTLLPQCLAVCKKEQIKDFVWDTSFGTRGGKTSNPMCLDKNHFPVVRECANITWKPILQNVNCAYKQNENWKDTFCPLGYNRIPYTTLCILIGKAQKWSEMCLQSTDADPFYFKNNSSVVKRLNKLGYERYWLPIRRDNLLDYVKYKIIPRYNIKFNVSLISEPINGNCLTYDGKDGKFYLSNCDNRYSMVCLIDVDKFFKFSKYHCPQDSYTTFNPRYHNHCYRVDQFNVSKQLRHLLIVKSEQEQLLADHLLITGNDFRNSHVLVDIMPDDTSTKSSIGVREFDQTNWIKNSKYINFTNWDSNFPISQTQPTTIKNVTYTTIKNGKWHLVSNTILYAIYVEQFDSIKQDPEFTIQFNKISSKFQINNTDHVSKFFGHSCFLNDNIMNDMSLGIGRKNFRCEGFTMETLKLIKSPTIEVWSDETSEYEIFVVKLKQNCFEECDFIQQSRLLQQEKSKKEGIEGLIVQFRKIIDIDTKSRVTTYSLHLLMKKKSSLTIKDMFSKLLNDFRHNIDLRHIDTCLGSTGKYLNFPDALIGENSTNQNCRQPNGDHPTLKCIGDSDVGAYWGNDIALDSLKCNYTHLLQEVYQNMENSNPVVVIQKLMSTTQTLNSIESLEYTSKIIDKLLSNSSATMLFDQEAEKPEEKRPFASLIKTYNNAIETNPVQDSFVNENFSSNFLESYKQLIEYYLQTNAVAIILKNSQDGTYLIQESNIILLVIDPFLGPATGMSIHKNRLRRKESNLIGFSAKIHHGNKTKKEIIDRRLEAGIYLHYRIINKLKRIYKNFRIVLSVFYKDSWFLENSNTADMVVSKSKIVGIFIPEYPDKELPEGVSTIFKTMRNRKTTIKAGGCSNWQTGLHQRGWNKNFHGSDNLDRNLVSCPIKYTSFSGYVQMIGNDKLIDCDIESHTDIIKWITIFMGTLSVIGVLLIFVAVLTIPALKRNDTTPLILIQVFANGLQILVYILFVELKLFNADRNEMIEEICLATGAILHYLTLVGFFLSLFATDHLIRAYVIGANQLISVTFKTKVILFGWMLPIVIVAVCILFDIIFDFELYLPIDLFDDHSSICYPVEELLLISIHLPITIIIIIHVIIFVWVVIKTNRHPDSVITKVSRLKEKCQTYMYIFSILSITWLFAVIVYYVENCWVHLIFSYLFAISAPSQGFQIFLIYVVFNGQVRNYFMRWNRNRKLNLFNRTIKT